MAEFRPGASNSAVEDVECLMDSDEDESAVKEVFLEVEDFLSHSESHQTSPQLNIDHVQAWQPAAKRQWSPINTNTFISALSKKEFQRQVLQDEEPSLVALSPDTIEDTKPPHLTLTWNEEDRKPAPLSLEPPLLVILADNDVKPSRLEQPTVQHAKPSPLTSPLDEEDVKPSPKQLMQVTLHGQQRGTGRAESPVNFWTFLEGEDSSSQSEEDPKNPVGRIATSDSDCKWEPQRKSHRKVSPESATDDDDDWDYQHERKGPAKKRSSQTLKRTQKKAQRSIANPSKKKRSNSSPSDDVRWRTHHEMDIEPWPLPFQPARLPGPQHSTSHAESPLDFFRLFFTDSVIKTVLKNTNAYGTQNILPRDGWKAFSFEDMFSFLSIVIFMGLLKLPQVVDYWKTTRPYNLPFPPSVMSKTKFLNMCRSLHMCSLQDDAVNQAAKGTSAYDHLGKIQPLYSQIAEACRTHFHPDQNLSIDERKVLPNERLSTKHNLRHKYTMGYKLFALADSTTGYAWNFFISDGSRTALQNGSGKSAGYDTVMSLVDLERLGSGYHLYVDHFYTSPSLFRDLLAQNIGACGPFPHNKMDFLNDFSPSSPRGSIRWIRDDELLFVKWKEPREVALCSTIHKAYGGETIQRRLKRGRTFVNVYLPIPPALMAYNQHMGVDNASDGLNCYYNVLLKTKKWYRTFFYHFVDVAVVNAHILYNRSHEDKRMTQREFRDALVQELADNGSGATSKRAPERPESATRTHKALFLSKGQAMPRQSAATFGRRRCALCNRKTPVGCETCDVALCFVPLRDCYGMWHKKYDL